MRRSAGATWPAGCGELTEESWMASMFHLGGALALGLRHWAVAAGS